MKRVPYAVYILQSEKTGRYYVGHSEEVEKRLRQHNAGESASTRHGVPWRLIYREVCKSRSDAIRRETQIKKRGIERFLRGVAQSG